MRAIANEKLDIGEFGRKLEEREKELRVTWDYVGQLEKQVKEQDSYMERVLPLVVLSLIDETLYNTVGKKADLLKALTDFGKGKFRQLEDRLKSGGWDKKTYAVPNFTVRDLEVVRIKNNKSKRSEKKGGDDMQSVKSSSKNSK